MDKLQARQRMELGGFDFTAFRTTAWHDVLAYRKAVLPTLDRRAKQHGEAILGIVVFGAVLLVVLAMCLGIAVSVTYLSIAVGNKVLVGLVMVAILALCAWACWGSLRREANTLPNWRHRFRLAHFAQQNAMRYFPALVDHSRKGAIFNVGKSRRTYDVSQTTSVPFVELGNQQCTARDSSEARFRRWGYFMIDLERNLPHLVLVSKKRGSRRRSRFPLAFRRDQVLSLEGNFDRYFTLYAPREYERDALYVFTPDVMARLIDEAEGCHIEIVDRWMFVYEPGGFNFQDAATWQRISRIVSTVGASMAKETFRYRDDRVPAYVGNAVGATGRRLRVAAPVGAVVIAVVVLAVHLAPLLR